MASDVLARLDAGIERQEMRLAGLREARDLIAGLAAPEARLLAGPKRGPRPRGDDEKKRAKRQGVRKKPAGDPPAEEFSHMLPINDVEVPCTEQEAAVLELLIDAGEGAVQRDRILPIYDGNNDRWKRSLKDLRRRLEPAHAGIDAQKGRGGGYRLVEAE